MSETPRRDGSSPVPPSSSVIGVEGIRGASPAVPDPSPGSGYASHDVVVVRLSSPPPLLASTTPLTPPSHSDGARCRDEDQQQRSDDNGNDDDEEELSLVLHCAKSLTPADMMDLYNGTGDATGHAVWKGAILFVEAFCVSRRRCHSTTHGSERLDRLGRVLFDDRRVVELGCGTGVSGLALLKRSTPPRRCKRRNVDDDEASEGSRGGDGDGATTASSGCFGRCHVDSAPRSVTFTDFDEGALELCRRNCEENLLGPVGGQGRRIPNDDSSSPSSYDLCKLRWGDPIIPPHDQHPTLGDNLRLLVPHSYDTVVATDVLYDVDSLRPLLRSASDLVRESGDGNGDDGGGGYLVLSHVPRATLQDEGEDREECAAGRSSVVASSDDLEGFIIAAASEVGGFELSDVVRPEHLSEAYGSGGAANDVPFSDMEGASILVFRR